MTQTMIDVKIWSRAHGQTAVTAPKRYYCIVVYKFASLEMRSLSIRFYP